MKTFHVKRIRTAQEAIDALPFFMVGLQSLNKLVQLDRAVKAETFCRVLFDTVSRGEDTGHVALYGDVNDPLAFSITYATFDPYREPTVIIYAANTIKTVPGLTRFALAHIEKWARSKGYKEIQTFSPRINGKGIALFEKRWGFRRWLLHFYKKI